jgi:hypothetical protein
MGYRFKIVLNGTEIFDGQIFRPESFTGAQTSI